MCLPECKQDLVLDKYISVHTCTGLWMLIQCSWSEMSLDWVCDEQKAAVSSPPPSCFAHTEESAEEKKKTLLQKILKSYSIFMERIEQFLNYHYTSNPLLKHRNTVEVKNRFNVIGKNRLNWGFYYLKVNWSISNKIGKYFGNKIRLRMVNTFSLWFTITYL